MGDFKAFQGNIRRKGGIWASEDVYFCQTRDYYIADYRPNYPKFSDADKTIYGKINFPVHSMERHREEQT